MAVMTRWRDGQRALGELILFGVVGAPEALMDPVLRRIDRLLDDEALVGAVWRVMRRRRRRCCDSWCSST
jgi:hypothetical protein